jgi:predicted nucleic acid-binding protein
MREVFADSFFWIALLDERDDYHQRAIELNNQLGPDLQSGSALLVTTDEALHELLAAFRVGARPRSVATQAVYALRARPDVVVLPQSRGSFDAGLSLYEKRPDKEYSLTDCISMQVMEQRGIHEVLTHDHHFEQAGYRILMPHH